MSIGTPNGILDITGATLRVSKMEFRQSTGFDTVLNNVARNTMLLMDETEQTTSNSWALKLPNAWVAEFHGYWASGSSGAPILFNFYNDSTSGTNGYTLSMNDTTISINYDGGSTLGSVTLSTTLNNDAYRKVAVIFERSVLDVSVDGEHVFHFADSQLRDRVYDNNSGYVTFTHSSTDERKLKNLKFTNGDKWVREIDSSNIAYVGGNVGIGTTIPGTKLDVSGTVRGTHLIGDGSAISAIQSSNVSDFGSNVTRIGTLETDLGDNSSRITNLSSNLSDNSSRITTLESGDISISGDKTFTGDIIFESNIHMNGGNVLVANTINMTVSDPIIELGLNNIGTNDLGIIMTRPAANSNVAFVYDESDDILRMGYTLNGASDSVVDLDSNALAVSVQGDLEVGTANLFVDTSTSRVGIGTDSPAYTLDVHGSSNVGALTSTTVSGDGSGLTSLNASNLASGTVPSARLSLAASDIPNLDATKITSGTLTRPISTTTGTFSGNVGIGTNNPIMVLDCYVDTSAYAGMQVRSSSGYAKLIANPSQGGHNGIVKAGDLGIVFSTDSAPSTNEANKGFYIAPWANDTSGIRINENGNVGIGTASPTARLDVEYNQGTLSSYNYSTTSTWHGKGLRLAGGSNSGGFLYGHDINHSIFLRQSPFSTNDHNAYCNVGYHAFYTGGHIQNQTERLRITSDGNVGIGTTSPSYKLDVAGTSNAATYYQNGVELYAQRRWEVDLTGQSTSNFYPVELKAPTYEGSPDLPDMFPVHFKVVGESLGGGNSYNESTLVGYARGGGWSDHRHMYDVHYKRYSGSEKRFEGVYRGSQDYGGGIVIYMRGGYRYSVLTDATEVNTYTSAQTLDNSVFAIKNVSGADVSGTSTAIGRIVHIAGANEGEKRFMSGNLQFDGNVGIGTTSPNTDAKLDVRGYALSDNPAFYAWDNVSSYTLSSIDGYTVHFDSTTYNIGSHYNTNNNRFTCPVAGTYIFAAVIAHDSAGGLNGSVYFSFYVNGVNKRDICEGLGAHTAHMEQHAVYITQLGKGDYVDVRSRSNSAINFVNGDHGAYYRNCFQGALLG